MNPDNLVENLKEYIRLNSIGEDTFLVENSIKEHEVRIDSKLYFLKINHGYQILFKTYNNNLDSLMQIGNSICIDDELRLLEVSILQTTEYGGTVIFNNSPIGMIKIERRKK